MGLFIDVVSVSIATHLVKHCRWCWVSGFFKTKVADDWHCAAQGGLLQWL